MVHFLTRAVVIVSMSGFVFTANAQESNSSATNSSATNSRATNSKQGFDWLTQFEGTWQVESQAPSAGSDAAGQKATMTSRVIGRFWVINEHSGDMVGMKFHAVQTLGYDSEKKHFTGRWIDNMMAHEWIYKGQLDESGNTLFLETEGPDWSNPKVMKQYRDVYEFKSANEIAAMSQIKNGEGEWETFMSSTLTKRSDSQPATSVTPFLMFEGQALEAIELYKSVFPDLKIESMNKYKAGEAGKEGTVQLATIVVAGQKVKCIDSPIKHDFTFTPSVSFFVECESEEQLKERFDKLAEGGKVMMPIGSYGFSQKFGWTSDKYGVNWQLNLK